MFSLIVCLIYIFLPKFADVPRWMKAAMDAGGRNEFFHFEGNAIVYIVLALDATFVNFFVLFVRVELHTM
ncbi:hypothetical protein [Leptospira gomenensis]|uniref:hypothetical protein n=1 Tax=Leptospira gomenensis TaxID=2484974 RepID=UPI001084523A|nr:hypothetical protein [Leptospira gomenensis]